MGTARSQNGAMGKFWFRSRGTNQKIGELRQILTWIIHEKWMKDENMLKKKDFGDTTVVAALRRGYRQRLYFEQIAVFRHKFMNYSG